MHFRLVKHVCFNWLFLYLCATQENYLIVMLVSNNLKLKHAVQTHTHATTFLNPKVWELQEQVTQLFGGLSTVCMESIDVPHCRLPEGTVSCHWNGRLLCCEGCSQMLPFQGGLHLVPPHRDSHDLPAPAHGWWYRQRPKKARQGL